jgi:hypothetical protein
MQSTGVQTANWSVVGGKTRLCEFGDIKIKDMMPKGKKGG